MPLFKFGTSCAADRAGEPDAVRCVLFQCGRRRLRRRVQRGALAGLLDGHVQPRERALGRPDREVEHAALSHDLAGLFDGDDRRATAPGEIQAPPAASRSTRRRPARIRMRDHDSCTCSAVSQLGPAASAARAGGGGCRTTAPRRVRNASDRRVDDRRARWLKSWFPDVPVSSRGQDTWFSATGPGFESPYRYQLSIPQAVSDL